jgi:transcriptional regulator with XRE-family HTH domain
MTTVSESLYSLQRERVEVLMAHRGIKTLAQLAELLTVDIRQVSRWLGNETQIKAQDLARIASVLDTSMDFLTGRSNDPGFTLEDFDLTPSELRLITAAREGNRDEALELLLQLFRSNRRS